MTYWGRNSILRKSRIVDSIFSSKYAFILRCLRRGLCAESTVASTPLNERLFVVVRRRRIDCSTEAVCRHRQAAFCDLKTLEVKGHFDKTAASNEALGPLSDTGIDMAMRPKQSAQMGGRFEQRLSSLDKVLRRLVKGFLKAGLFGWHAAKRAVRREHVHLVDAAR